MQAPSAPGHTYSVHDVGRRHGCSCHGAPVSSEASHQGEFKCAAKTLQEHGVSQPGMGLMRLPS